ncbi:MAG: RyR domain-containing protein [Bacteroidales bacterium]|nr:RyR domain-containing protein [Bacteroidales bacterium]
MTAAPEPAVQTYVPKPLDTSDVQLSEELDELAESLAKNVHEVWSANRIAEGWTYGRVRDDVKKTHPCLIPYEDLPESEKDYDRSTSSETLKMIVSLGFEVRK